MIDKTELKVSPLEIITRSYEMAIADINVICDDIVKDYEAKGGIALPIAKEMAKDRYILGGIYMLSGKGVKQKIKETIEQEKKDKARQLELLLKEEETTDGK